MLLILKGCMLEMENNRHLHDSSTSVSVTNPDRASGAPQGFRTQNKPQGHSTGQRRGAVLPQRSSARRTGLQLPWGSEMTKTMQI